MFTGARIRMKWYFLFILLVSIAALLKFSKWPWSDHTKDLHKSERCLVYSPAYPSAGGGGCSPLCTKRNGQKTWSSGAVYYENHQKWPQDLVENMHHAASILKTFGKPLRLDNENGRRLHVAFDYYCCYTEEEQIKIGQFLKSYSWTPHKVRFDKIECAIHGYNGAVSLVLMLDKKAQEELTRSAMKSEQELETTTGIHKHIPHTHLQNFHMTLGVLNGSYFPVKSAVEEINKQIPPGTWHKSPVVLKRPVCKKCKKMKSRN